MKKYLLGVIALALAMGFSAFTTDFHGKRDTTYFKYTSTDPNGYTDIANWAISTTLPPGCSGGTSTCIVSSNQFTTKQELVNYLENIHMDPQVPGGDEYRIEDKQLQLAESE